MPVTMFTPELRFLVHFYITQYPTAVRVMANCRAELVQEFEYIRFRPKQVEVRLKVRFSVRNELLRRSEEPF